MSLPPRKRVLMSRPDRPADLMIGLSAGPKPLQSAPVAMSRTDSGLKQIRRVSTTVPVSPVSMSSLGLTPASTTTVTPTSASGLAVDVGATMPKPAAVAAPALPARPDTADRDSRKEWYAIKQVCWLDPTGKLRTQPILVQAANGPCPLLALANTLVLTGPADGSGPIETTLRSREHVSLGLLLDAAVDELTARQTTDQDGDSGFDDVAQLYAFLAGLHTGMNVNPVFVPGHRDRSSDPATADDQRDGDSDDSAPDAGTDLAGGFFEPTPEIALYSLFNVPLIHGWLPGPDPAVVAAFSRSARTYEEAQVLLLREDSLLERFCRPDSDGLSENGRTDLEHVLAVKDFLTLHPSQLTEAGLDQIAATVPAGQFYILFRNDHFSTLYKEPRTGMLMTLVTDAGYAGHAEIVWESLVDVSGLKSRLMSGDFREVGGTASAGLGRTENRRGQETQASTRPRRQSHSSYRYVHSLSRTHTRSRPTSSSAGPLAPLSTTVVAQTDDDDQVSRDLALAMHLQEEEDELWARHHRRSSRAGSGAGFVGPAGGRTSARPPMIPPRRYGSTAGVANPTSPTYTPDREFGGAANTNSSSNVNVSDNDGSFEPPPPTYDQVARADRMRLASATSAATAQAAAGAPSTRPFSHPSFPSSDVRKKEKCVVM